MSRRLIVVIAAMAIVVLVGGGLLFWVSRPHGAAAAPAQPASSAPVATPSATSLTESSSAATALMKLNTDPSSLLPADEVGKVNLVKALPAGSTVTPDPSTWKASTPTSGVMVVNLKLASGDSSQFIVTMQKDSTGWKILMTIPVAK
jgi:hypothetical protein